MRKDVPLCYGRRPTIVVLLGDFEHCNVGIRTEECTASEAYGLEEAVPVRNGHMRWEIIPADGHGALEQFVFGIRRYFIVNSISRPAVLDDYVVEIRARRPPVGACRRWSDI